jgi:radical SAM protein with 4Fe4S-binding SPASM domain
MNPKKINIYPYKNTIKYYPHHAVLELSLLCNMMCTHCGSRAGKARENELSISEWLDIAQQLIDMEVKHVTLIGGEILLVKDWEMVARKFLDAGVNTNIITNAYLLDDYEINKIKTIKLNGVGISLDGMAKTHNAIRNKEGSFEKIANALSKLKAAGIPFAVITTLIKNNFSELESMYQLVAESGANNWQLQLASPMGNASCHSDYLLEPEKIPTLIEFIKNKNKLGKLIITKADNLCYKESCHKKNTDCHDTNSTWHGCMAGLQVIGIDSIGNVRGCESLYADIFIEGNLRNESLAKIWNKDGNFSYNRNFELKLLKGKCKLCDRRAWCAGGCRQLSYFTSGSYYKSIYCNYTNKPSFRSFLSRALLSLYEKLS